MERFRLQLTLVFDAMHQPELSRRSHYKSLEVIFTSRRESADHYLLRVIEEAEMPSKITLVSSDRELAWKARLKGAHTQSVENFLQMIAEPRKAHRSLISKQKQVTPPQAPRKASSPPQKKKPSENLDTKIKKQVLDPELEAYREIFEKRYDKEKDLTSTSPKQVKPLTPMMKSRKKQSSKKHKLDAPTPEDKLDGESEYERWLRLFSKQ